MNKSENASIISLRNKGSMLDYCANLVARTLNQKNHTHNKNNVKMPPTAIHTFVIDRKYRHNNHGRPTSETTFLLVRDFL